MAPSPTRCTNSQGREVDGSLLILCEDLPSQSSETTSASVVSKGSDAFKHRTYVFPGEQVTILCTIEEEKGRPASAEQLEELRTRHCYSLTLTAVEGEGAGGKLEEAREKCVDTLEVSSINRSQETSSTSPVAGIARSISKCWRESGASETEPGRIIISIEASVPSSFPSRRCKAKLELQQYLKYPLGSRATRGGGTEETERERGDESSDDRKGKEVGSESSSLYLDGLFEHFLCRTWTKEIDVLRPIKVESFVSNQSTLKPEAFLSVTVGNILPNKGETSKCVLAVQSFQLLSDPPERLVISQVFPKRSIESKEHPEIQPGTEHSFVIRTSFNDLGKLCEVGSVSELSSSSSFS